jgi:nucleolar protein 56
LPEEKALALGKKLDVTERRLVPLGELVSFKIPEIKPEEFGFSQAMLSQAMVLLGKDKVRVSATPDEQILQAIRAIDDITKTINLMSERLHEWFDINFPELARIVPDPKYVELIAQFGDRKAMLASGQVKLDASMGSEISEEDSEALKKMASSILALYKTKDEMEKFVEVRMKVIARNTAHVAGPLIGARLISLAGGLKRLARLPSSTVQLLGAEKALFKHLRDKARPPKHGVIFQNPLIHRAPAWQRGKIARALAAKISLAAKIDMHGNRFIGEDLERDLAKKLQEIQRKYPVPPAKKVQHKKKR